jgi:hypothetical protein
MNFNLRTELPTTYRYAVLMSIYILSKGLQYTRMHRYRGPRLLMHAVCAAWGRRRTLERQRIKNIKSAQNAIRQREKQLERQREFQEELRVAQINREARNARFAKARQLLIDELEEEAPLWMTTPEEVEAAFTPEAEQLLWARPHGVLGAPTPTEDVEFWRYHSLSPYKGRTYPLAREILLDELEEASYVESNMDSAFWTEERLGEREELEEKARLRAMVYDAGKRALLRKQQEILQGRFAEEESRTKIPQPMPVPNVKILANTKAMEKEGVDLLLKDPTQFFEFEDRQQASEADDAVDGEEATGDESYQGPSLGAPIGLKRPSSYPQIVGKLPKADTRTERQKKREERERKMLEAARAASGDDDDELDVFDVSKMTFDSAVPYDSDDEQWIKDRELDPGDDPDMVKMPYGLQYNEEDIDWVVSQLEQKVSQLNEQLRVEVRNAHKEAQALQERGAGKADTEDLGDSSPQTGTEVDMALKEAGIDVERYEAVLASLTSEQMTELITMEDSGFSMPLDEVKRRLEIIPGLTDDQIDVMMEAESALRSNEKLQEALGANADDEDPSLDFLDHEE